MIPIDPTQREQTPNLVIRGAAVVAVVAYLVARFDILPTLLVVGGLIVCIFLHELGHFVTARWSGMKVTEFFLGFGPKLWSTRRGDVEYGVKAIPAGAYVRIVGMNNLEEVDPADEPATYRQQSFPKRLVVVSAGSTMHFLIAFVLLCGLLIGYGEPKDDVWRVREVSPKVGGQPSPAARIGLRPGDRIVAVDGNRLDGFSNLSDELRDRPGEKVSITVARGSKTFTRTVALASVVDDGERVGRLGITSEHPLQRLGPVAAAPRAIALGVDIGRESLKALGSFFAPSHLVDYGERVFGGGGEKSGSGASGDGSDEGTRFLSPVGFVQVASASADRGLDFALELLILINIFVGIFNLVPLLPFDGGHIAVATYERLRSRRGRAYHADVAKLLPLTYGVVMVLAFIGLSALWLDISDPIQLPGQ